MTKHKAASKEEARRIRERNRLRAKRAVPDYRLEDNRANKMRMRKARRDIFIVALCDVIQPLEFEVNELRLEIQALRERLRAKT